MNKARQLLDLLLEDKLSDLQAKLKEYKNKIKAAQQSGNDGQYDKYTKMVQKTNDAIFKEKERLAMKGEARRIVVPTKAVKKPHEIYKEVTDKLNTLGIKDNANLKELASYFSTSTHLVDKNPVKVLADILGDKLVAKDVLDSMMKMKLPNPTLPSNVEIPEVGKFDHENDGHLLVSKLYHNLVQARTDGFPLRDLEEIAHELLVEYSMGDSGPGSVGMEITTQGNPFIVKVWDKFHKDYKTQMDLMVDDNEDDAGLPGTPYLQGGMDPNFESYGDPSLVEPLASLEVKPI